jgi:steroid delta-isomerase-like uncharacterized protein
MSTEANEALVRQYVQQVENGHNLAALDEFMSDDLVDHSVPPGLPPGREGTRQVFTMYIAAFPDLQATIDDLIAAGDKVVIRGTVCGTHQGELMGIPATRKRVTFTGIHIFRIAGGKIAEHWLEMDTLGLLQQLGAVPAPAQAGR